MMMRHSSRPQREDKSTRFSFLLPICDAVDNAMTLQVTTMLTNAYCMVVLHARMHEPLVHSQPKPKIVHCATGKPTLDLQVALSASST